MNQTTETNKLEFEEVLIKITKEERKAIARFIPDKCDFSSTVRGLIAYAAAAASNNKELPKIIGFIRILQGGYNESTKG